MKFVIGIPTVNRKDLLLESLDDLSRGFGDKLHKLIILDNGHQQILQGNANNSFPENFKDKLHLEEEPENRGCGGSWNKILDLAFFTYEADHVLMLNDDIVLGKSYEELESMIDRCKDYNFIVTSFFWSAFLISKQTFLDVGYFDPIFYPAYYEDNDYHLRMRSVYKDSYIEYTVPELLPTVQRNSMTIAVDRTLSRGSQLSQKFRDKWGTDPTGECWEYPYNNKELGYKLDSSTYDTGVPTPHKVIKPTYIIWTPGFAECSGGIIVLHYLCHNLNEYGEKAYITGTSKINPAYNTPIFKGDFNDPNNIIIYPEIVGDNPCGVKNVVRYLLYYADVNRYPKSDMLLGYHSLYTKDLKGDIPLLTLYESKEDYFTDKGKERRGECYIDKKSSGKVPHIHQEGSYRLGGQEADESLLQIFNNHKRFYSYDNETYLNTIAVLCGCESVIVPDPDKKREDVIDRQPAMRYGVAWGVEEIELANTTKHNIREGFQEIREESKKQLLDFVRITKERFLKYE